MSDSCSSSDENENENEVEVEVEVENDIEEEEVEVEVVVLTAAEKDRFIRENWQILDLDYTSNFPDGTSCSEYAMEFFRNEHRVRQKRSRNNN